MTRLVWQHDWLDENAVLALRERQRDIALDALEHMYCPPLSPEGVEALLDGALAIWAVGPASALNRLADPDLRAGVLSAYHNPNRRAGVLLYKAEGMDEYAVACVATSRNAVKLMGAGALYIHFEENRDLDEEED